MSDKEQNTDREERLLDTWDRLQTTEKEWDELLADPDNAEDFQLLKDCRMAFICEDPSLAGEPDIAWRKFLAKHGKKRKMRRLWTVRVVVGVACVLLVANFWWLNILERDGKSRMFVAYCPDTTRSEVVLSTSAGVEKILVSARVDNLFDNMKSLANKELILTYKQEGLNPEPEVHTLTTSSGGFYQLLLSDSTHVWLNSESRLVYPSFFEGEERIVELQGEAFFRVAYDSLRPFKVKARNVVTEVLGTEFNIRTYLQEDIHVTLLQGSVKVRNENAGQEVVIRPGEDAGLQEDGSFLVKEVDTDAYYLWTKGYFYFDNESLLEIMRELGRWYNVRVVFRNAEVRYLRLHFLTERDKSIDNTLKLLNMMGDVKVTFEDNTLFID